MSVDPEDFDRMWHDMYGNGKQGLVADMRDVKRALFKNADTGENGLVHDVGDIKKMMTQFNGGWKLIGVILVALELLRATGVL